MTKFSSNEAQVTPGASSIADLYHLVIPEYVDHEGLPHEAAMYCGILAALTTPFLPKVIVEIGTQRGMSTRIFLAATGLSGGLVHSTDVDPECGQGKILEDLKRLGFLDRWRFRCGRSQDLEPIASDILYVDGDHSYEAVCSDMARYGVLVRDGGLVIMDDYNLQWPGKMQWVDERWDVLDPLIVGPFAVFRVTPEKREHFGPVAPSTSQPLTDMGEGQLKAYGAAFVEAHKRVPGGMSLEVGSRRGGSALLFLKMLERLYPDPRTRPMLFTVDPYGGKPYVGGKPGDKEIGIYDTDEYVAMKRLLKDYPNHAHFMMASLDFLDMAQGARHWQDGNERRLGHPAEGGGLAFALLDGEHSADTIDSELGALWGTDGGPGSWMHPSGIVCVDNTDTDPETRPMIEADYIAEFGTDGNEHWAVIRGVK